MATALIVAIRTAPAATSFASFASGSNEVVATSIACSSAELTISVMNTNAIASSSAISSSFETPVHTAAACSTAPPARCRCGHGRAGAAFRSGAPRDLLRLHLRPVVVPEQVQQAVHERRPPLVADDLRAENGVAELA